ncbi:MAG TPA: hypothetical protein VIG48_02700 [Jatrophihabitans sp.]|jgi:hypothetical protein
MRQSRSARRIALALGAAALAVASVAVAAPSAQANARRVHVWRVGTWHGVRGNVSSIGAAIRRAHAGDWILIAPGDYHVRMDHQGQRGSDHPAGLLITKPGLHIRGMNRNGVVLDGTKPGSRKCSSAPQAQDFGASRDAKGRPSGRNGIEVFKTNNVSISNLTACNFLSGTQHSGNEIWWNGGDDSGKIGMGSWHGSYLSATSTYYSNKHKARAALYGLFVSNSRGPGSLLHSYASNFSDSGYYIGACPNCRAVISDAHAFYNALGYSGTNSGGRLVIKHSEFAFNKVGFDTNSQNSADAPSPQNGKCPKGARGPTGTRSCWVFENNYVHDNNNPNVPSSGDAALGPVGTGISLAGSRNDTIVHNRFVHNGAWAVLMTVFPDSGAGAPGNNCRGGVRNANFFGQQVPCLFDVFSNEAANNSFRRNGFFGNTTNGDLADLSQPPSEAPGAAGDCFHGNTRAGGAPAKTWPTTLQTTQGTCGRPVYPDQGSTAALAVQVACNTEAFGKCPPSTGHYPRLTRVRMHPLPKQPTMPHPCAGVPSDPWCR